MNKTLTLPTEVQSYIHLSRYARYLDDKGRRETWEETVTRYFDYFVDRMHTEELRDSLYEEGLWNAVHDLEVMPSMRALMTAGAALDRDNVAGYNCAYVAVDDIRAFDEAMYVLMCGTGVGFSVERDYIHKLPVIKRDDMKTRLVYHTLLEEDPELAAMIDCNGKYRDYLCLEYFPECNHEEISYINEDGTIIVQDSKVGWASALRHLIVELYNGNFNVSWDTSLIRPAGERLVTFGGRASGPAPLESLFTFIKSIFVKAEGRQLHTLECHDIMCKIAQVVVVGGVRRSAMISLSNLSDMWMQKAKTGTWYDDEKQRALSNNSVAYTEKPDVGTFLGEFYNLYESKSGERGIFNRRAAQRIASKFARRSDETDYGTNPCSEIILRSCQFCNLSEVVVRPEDTLEDLRRKVRLASILGTLQCTLTSFRYLRAVWKDNTEEERLLGVSMTGIMDHPVLNGSTPYDQMPTDPTTGGKYTLAQILRDLKEVAVDTNKEWAGYLGINPSAAVTCVKPSGTVSQLCNTASGMHTRHSPHYLRTYRADAKDPLAEWMRDQGFPCEQDVQERHNLVFSFPVKAPESSITRNDRTAIEMLELWKTYQLHWCEHKPSVTINVREDEWPGVMAWVYENFDILSGVSFLPFSDHIYAQAPEQELSEDEYNEWLTRMPKDVDWSTFTEETDNTTGSQELACVGGACELT